MSSTLFDDRFAYRKSEFACMPDSMYGTIVADLSNNIHPLFARNKFVGLTNAEYDQLEMPLKLASRMLGNERVARLVVTMTEGDLCRILPDGSTTQSKRNPQTLATVPLTTLSMDSLQSTPLVRQRRRTMAFSDMKTRSDEILLQLAGMLDRIQVDHSSDPSDYTEATTNAPQTSVLQNFPAAKGCMALMNLRRSTVWTFRNYTEHSLLRLVYQFELAKTIVHEMAHVLTIAIHGPRHDEVWYDTACCNEIGFEIELALFGGIIDMMDIGQFRGNNAPPTPVQVLVREQYPAQRFIQMYANSTTSPKISNRCAIDKYSVVDRIPFQFVASMFEERFWIEEVPRMGTGPIQPTELYSWVIYGITGEKDVDDTYINGSGTTIRVTTATKVACSLRDPSYPQRVRDALQIIMTLQRDNQAKGLCMKRVLP